MQQDVNKFIKFIKNKINNYLEGVNISKFIPRLLSTKDREKVEVPKKKKKNHMSTQ